MILYHGGLVAVPAPVVLKTDLGRDFGPAFYTTDIREQAERWALRRRLFAMKSGGSAAAAVVSEYEFEEVSARARLKCRDFDAVSSEWLDMVVQCRSSPAFRHGFDLVTGKIANDNVGETVSYVVAGVMPREMALERLKFQQINNQVAFSSDSALAFLKFVRSYEVEVG